MPVSGSNSKVIPITVRQGINHEFHQAFQTIYSKQDVDDSPQVIQVFLDGDGDTLSTKSSSTPRFDITLAIHY